MSAEPNFLPYTSPEEYFELETGSPFRHEYVDGVMYTMAQTGRAHSLIGVALLGLVHSQLRECECEIFSLNMKLKVPGKVGAGADFYYPDATIGCDPLDFGEVGEHAWREHPSVIFEIVSPNTRAVDGGRKRKVYLGLPSLEAYVRIEDSAPVVTIDRKADGGWETEHLTELAEAICLPMVGVEVRLQDLYARVFPRV